MGNPELLPETPAQGLGSSKRTALGKFPPLLIRPPLSGPHKNTVIFLHGRGSNAEKFGDPLLSAQTRQHGEFRQSFPHTRFVFPTAPLMRATKYRRSIIHQWYDGSGDWEPEARGYMRDTVEYIHALLRAEIQMVGGDTGRIVLAGISQGCAMALTCLLLWDGSPLGAVVGMCGFMPITAPLVEILDGSMPSEQAAEGEIVSGTEAIEEEEDDDVFDRNTGDDDGYRSPIQQVIDTLREEVELPDAAPPSSLCFGSTPVFLGHGVKDEEVDHLHTREAVDLLRNLGIAVDFRAYPELGHWYSAEMLSDVISFLAQHIDL